MLLLHTHRTSLVQDALPDAPTKPVLFLPCLALRCSCYIIICLWHVLSCSVLRACKAAAAAGVHGGRLIISHQGACDWGT